jgi:hypothetical protein
MKLEFKRPMEDACETLFDFTPVADGAKTDVKWTMQGKNNFMGRAMCLFMDMDAMIGKDFEKGLANLKAVAEKVANSHSTNDEPSSFGDGN